MVLQRTFKIMKTEKKNQSALTLSPSQRSIKKCFKVNSVCLKKKKPWFFNEKMNDYITLF